jgi:hypothetical protein
MVWIDTRTNHEIAQDAAYERAKNAGRRLDAALTTAIKEGLRPMSKISTVGGAMTTLKAKLDKRAEGLLARIQLLDKAGEEKFGLADHALAVHETELSEMENELRQLGNFPPLAGLANGSGGSGGSGGDKK